MTYKETDAWLRERGWVPDGNAWRLMVGPRVRIYSFDEACKFQQRSDRAKRAVSLCEKCNLGAWRPIHKLGTPGAP